MVLRKAAIGATIAAAAARPPTRRILDERRAWGTWLANMVEDPVAAIGQQLYGNKLGSVRVVPRPPPGRI
jgi:hypothetical protein